ncbi:hypothetical protein GF324_10680 [bacterium]|nr:hypothetical protein [bacterium]
MSDPLPLRVILAGHSIDTSLLEQLKQAAYSDGDPPPLESITPETLSAAYARISRNPAEIPELRAAAREEVEKARKSNENIIFGLGHASVAEHACFNFDVVGISRLAVEQVEYHRLASFTEKSQRYIKLDGDIVIPPEIEEAGMTQTFRNLIQRQNSVYFELYPKLVDYFELILREEGEEKPKRAAKSRAAEDARYVVSLATQAQFGMTINARTLEVMARRTLAHPLAEVRAFGSQLREAVTGLAPSLVKYVDATQYERHRHRQTRWWAAGAVPEGSEPDVQLVDYDEDAEQKVIAALLARMKGDSYTGAMNRVREMNREKRERLVKEALLANAPWDPAPREFEIAHFTYEITLSAAAFGQLKRHRMASLLTGPYDPALGWTMPESVNEVGGAPLFDAVMETSAEFARELAHRTPAAAPYALTNAHRRRVMFHASARELQHLSRLREDLHAQWDIRIIAKEMIRLARQQAPLLLLLAGGKHEFDRLINRLQE